MFFGEWVCVVIFTVDYVLRLTRCCAPRRARAAAAPPPQQQQHPRAPTHLPLLSARARVRALEGVRADEDIEVHHQPDERRRPRGVCSVLDPGGHGRPAVRRAEPRQPGRLGVRLRPRDPLVRVFRVFKVGKLALGFKMMAGSITNSMETMSVLMIVMGVVVTLFSSIMHLIEAPGSALATDELIDAAGMGPCPGRRQPHGRLHAVDLLRHDPHPGKATTTMTTVGYGDCYPVTWAGKMVSVLTFIVGIGVLGLIVTVLGNNFSAQVEMCAAPSRRRRRRRAHLRLHLTPSTRDALLATPCAHTGTRRRRCVRRGRHDGDGELDEEEPGQFLLSKKKEGRPGRTSTRRWGRSWRSTTWEQGLRPRRV